MLRKAVKFENYSVSGLHYIGYGMNFVIPGSSIGDDGVTVNLPLDDASAIKAAVLAKRPAMKMTDGDTFEDGVYPDYAPFQKDNYAGTVAPDADNDVTEGYSIGSVWVNTTATPHEVYRCVDATEGAAVWLNTSLETSELGSMALQNAGEVAITGGMVEAEVTPTNDMNIPETKVYKVNGVQVVGAPGLAVTDASAVAGTATNGGYGFVSSEEMSDFISGVNGMKDAVNAVISRLEGHGLIAAGA